MSLRALGRLWGQKKSVLLRMSRAGERWVEYSGVPKAKAVIRSRTTEKSWLVVGGKVVLVPCLVVSQSRSIMEKSITWERL